MTHLRSNGVKCHGMPVNFKLYLGTSKEAAIGPDAIISALMIDFIRRPEEWPKNPAYDGVSSPYLAQIASFFLGCGLAFLGTVQLGFLVNFISSSGTHIVTQIFMGYVEPNINYII